MWLIPLILRNGLLERYLDGLSDEVFLHGEKQIRVYIHKVAAEGESGQLAPMLVTYFYYILAPVETKRLMWFVGRFVNRFVGLASSIQIILSFDFDFLLFTYHSSPRLFQPELEVSVCVNADCE